MMGKDKYIHKLYAFALAAVFALTLAGCGGGGGGTTAAPPPDETPMPTPQEQCEAANGRYNADGTCTSAADVAEEMALSGAQSGAAAAASAAMAAVAGAVDPVAATNAQMYADAATTASEAAAAATDSATAMGHRTDAETARDKAVAAAGMRGLGLTALANKITNQSDIDNAVLEGKTGDDVPKPVSNAVRVGTELAAEAAIAPAVADTPESSSGAGDGVTSGSVGQGGGASTHATYGASGPSFTVTLPSGVEGVSKGETPVSLTTRGGWMGAELVGSGNNNMSYAIVATDIQAPTVKNNYAVSTYDASTLQGHLASDPEITGDVPSDGSDFTAMYNFDPEDNVPPVAGMFDCPTPAPTNGCSVSVKDGVVESIQGYIFRARTPGTTPTADADYLAWGVWLQVPDAAPADATPAAAGAFASGNDPFTVNEALKGTAEYNGVASGMYSAGGMVEYFDADVTLNANFGGNVAADSVAADGTVTADVLLGAVTGSVSNIKAGGMDVAGSLTLKRAPVISASANAPSTGGFTGTVSGTLAGRAMAGNWGGQFYGPNDATGKGIETEYPTTAAGTFGASAPGNSNDPVRILGAFGTWKAE